MKKLALFLVCLGLCGFTVALADVIYVSGDVSGTWSADSIIVTAEVRVPPQDTLVIEPGVKVLFFDYCKFIVDAGAVLRAVGTVNDTILFDEYWQGNRWKGIRFLNASDSSKLEYCHLTHGRATGSGEDARGGGVYFSNSSPTIRNCLIENCSCDPGGGGGIGCWNNSNPTIVGNTIRGNTAAAVGGGIRCNVNSNPVIISNTIMGNRAEWGNGGGIGCDASSPAISGNTITGNSTGYHGGGISCDGSSNPVISDNMISGNSASNRGGGVHCYNNSNPTISGNTISTNSAFDGGGVFCDGSHPNINNNTISGNSANYAGGIFCESGSCPTINDNTISGNSATHDNGGGICCHNGSNATITENTISQNSADDNGGGISCYYSNPAILGDTVSGNTCGGSGGGIYCTGSSPIVQNCVIDSCSAWRGGGILCATNSHASIRSNTISRNLSGGGGGIYINVDSGPVVIRDNVIRGNSATQGGCGGGIQYESAPDTFELNEITCNTASDRGGGVFLISQSPILNKSTIADNQAATGGGLYCYDSSPLLQNCILWGNAAQTSPMIYQTGGSNTHVAYSDLQDFWSDTTNIFDDPLFVDPVNRDYHLQIGSPCIDTGDPALPADPDSTVSDMGAYWCDQGYRPPSAFSLMSPHWGDTCWTSGTLLVWQAAHDTNTNDTVSYEVWLDTLANFSTRWEVASGLHDTTHALGWLADNHTYYWWVHASDLNTLGRWALSRLMFRTYFPEPPTGFALLEPEDGSQVPYGNVNFCWQAAHDPDPHDAVTCTLRLATNDTSLSYATGSDTCRALDIGALGLGDGVIVEWWVEAHSSFPDTTLESASHFHFYPPSAVSGEDILLPTEFALYQNYPNPFNPMTTIRYDVPMASQVRLVISNLLGQEVTRLVDERQLAGSYTVFWNAANWPSGVYLCQMEAGGFVQTRKMMLVK